MPSRSAVPARWSGSVCRSPVRSSLTRKSRDRVHIPHAPSKNNTPLMLVYTYFFFFFFFSLWASSLSTLRAARRQVGHRLPADVTEVIRSAVCPA